MNRNTLRLAGIAAISPFIAAASMSADLSRPTTWAQNARMSSMNAARDSSPAAIASSRASHSPVSRGSRS